MIEIKKISEINLKISSLRLIFNILEDENFKFNIQLKSSLFIISFNNDNSLLNID